MATVLKDKLASQIPSLRDEIRGILKEHGAQKISDVTIAQAYGGMRGVKGMICDTSLVEPDKGLIIRGIPLLEGLCEKWPEEIYWLLLTGELPTEEERKSLSDEYAARSEVPGYVWDVLRAMPEDSHPMVMFDTGILVMEKESKFRAGYDQGMKKTEYWDPMFEGSPG
jgi:citrate synthase